MKNTLLTLLLTLGFLSQTQAQQQACQFPEVGHLKGGSGISTFVFDYWDFSKNKLDLFFSDSDLKFILSHKNSPVVGDYHFNNVGIYYDAKLKKPNLAVIDLDDSGLGNQYVDFMKLILYIKSEFKGGAEVETEKILKHYVSGLESANKLVLLQPKAAEKLPELAVLLNGATSDQKYFEKLNAAKVAKKIEFSKASKSYKFEIKKGSLLKEISEIKEQEKVNEFLSLKKILASKEKKYGKISDEKFQINDSGSSIGAYRFIFLMERPGLKYSIVEFKENACPGTGLFTKQLAQAARFSMNTVNFSSAEYWKQAEIVDLPKSSYLLREKYENPLEEISKIDKEHKLQTYANFYSYTLGRFHSKGANSDYVEELTEVVNDSNKINVLKSLIDATENFVENYERSLADRTQK